MAERVADIRMALGFIDQDKLSTAEQEVLKAAHRMLDQLDVPEIEEFAKAVVVEALHQRVRWGRTHDAHKTVSDWIRLGTHLLGKASMADWDGNPAKLKHHIITTGAAMNNFHAAVVAAEQKGN